MHVGTLGLVMEPIGAAIERLMLTDVPPARLVLLDPNCRPGAVADHDAYRRRDRRIAAPRRRRQGERGGPGLPVPGRAARGGGQRLLAAGPSLVLVTDGPRPARAFLPARCWPNRGPAVPVADTIGAGDAFGGGFLAWWTANGLGREDLRGQRSSGSRAPGRRAVAALTCARPGADPPTRAELRARNWWPSRGRRRGG